MTPAVSAYASFMRSFVVNTGVPFGGGTFDPQRGTQYEIGLKAELGDRVSATLAAYELTRSNVPTVDLDHPGFNVLVGEQRSRGVELDVTGRVGARGTIAATYTYTDAQVTKDNSIRPGNRLLNVPEHAFRAWVSHRLHGNATKGLLASAGVGYQTRITGDLQNSFFIPAATYVDAALAYEAAAWRAALNLKNAFDETYYRTHVGRTVIPAAPRTLMLTVAFRL